MAEILYTDINAQVGLIRSPVLHYNQDAVIGAILNLFGTELGERVFLPEFGGLLGNYLFDPVDDETAFNLELGLIEAIRRWEPRVSLVRNKTSVVPHPDDGVFVATIALQIDGLPIDQEYTIFIRTKYAQG